MKNKIILLIIAGFLISFSGFSQATSKPTHTKLNKLKGSNGNTSLQSKSKDTSVKSGQIKSKSGANKKQLAKNPQTIPAKKKMYRDTRLGSSSKLYNTYKKNKYGAGAVTTSPK